MYRLQNKSRIQSMPTKEFADHLTNSNQNIFFNYIYLNQQVRLG